MIRTMIAALVLTTSVQASETKKINPYWSLSQYEHMCIADTVYQGGIMFFVRCHSEWQGADIRLCNKRWKITPGKEYEGTIVFNDANYDIPLVGSEGDTVGGKCLETKSWFGFDTEVYSKLMVKPWWNMSINGKMMSGKKLLLRGSKEALAILAGCHQSIAGGTFDRSPDSGDTF